MTFNTHEGYSYTIPTWYVEQWCSDNETDLDKLQEGNQSDWVIWEMLVDYEHQLAWGC